MTLLIEDQKKEVKGYLKSRFNLQLESSDTFNEFLNNSIKGIVAVKIWREILGGMDTNPSAIIYLDEIISNLNQIVVMGANGFKIPSAILIRRSYENMDGYLYYKDHPVEFFLKELDTPKRFIKGDELKGYFEKFPFVINGYDKFDKDKAEKLISLILKHKSEQYAKLSNFVHATNKKYYQLSEYIEDIVPDDVTFSLLNVCILDFNTILNCKFILFFFNNYQELTEDKKSIIRTSIGSGNKRYKNQIREIFGEI